ncbi:murein biosynthesis integral membrane protein MurJ [Kineococcus rhizosphaerae]|uniref:Putative peptidoglycan lipid II flippase n=1 Tax=Kineococcus rhizosphaerae TaxID=559628 RepID=A0A2T0R9E3_9ACTN|nr:lipid II flippase MurJ [Kineococcus rhizosphaerae]PRY17779.1 putative peptidoglycan lipid II flippase [Kineococcus rhizosphaerae]
MSPRARSVAAAAASVALLTVLARLAGFGRVLAFSQTVGDTCLGTAYTTANQVPNVLFEVVAGGALAGVLVPLLSSRLVSDDPRERAAASRTASAALTWSVLALVVVGALTALLARPVMALLLREGAVRQCGDSLLGTGTVMLWVFLPQIPLYAVAVVFAGVLQAQQRFTAPAAAPLVSSLVVGVSYLVVGALVPAAVVKRGLADVPAAGIAVLAGGTTLGVVALAATHAPALRGPVRWRPALRPAAGDGPRLRSLALSGLAVLVAQQVVTVAITVAANGTPGAVNRWSYAWALFLLPYAVLAVPVATAVFPRLARAADAGRAELAAILAPSVRTVLLVSSLGAAVLAAVAAPVSVVFVAGRAGSGQTGDLSLALVLFAPALLGYGLVALLTRALYTVGAGRSAAVGTVAGWGVVLVGVVVLPLLVPADRTVSAVAVAHTLGLSVAGALLLRAVHRAVPGATAGAGPVLAAAVLAALVAGGAGVLLTSWVRTTHVAPAVGEGLLVAALASGAWFAVARAAAPADLRTLVGNARRVVRR